MKSAAMLADIGIPLAGTLRCQVVGFTLEPMGFSVKRFSWLEGTGGWRLPRFPLSGRVESAKCWKNGRRGREGGKERPEGEQQVVPGSGAKFWKKRREQDAMVQMRIQWE